MAKNNQRRLWLLLAVMLLGMMAPVLTIAATPETAGFGQPVSDQTLSQHRGGHAITLNEQNLGAHLFDNQAYNNVTGTNRIADHAFAGSSGVPTVIQNTGNNVIIQNATILNVNLQ